MKKEQETQENKGPAQDKPAQKLRKKTAKKPKKSVKKTLKDAKKAQTTRRKRSDGIAESVNAVQAAFRDIEPPENVKLRKPELRFWDSIIAEFAKVEWTDHTLELAAMLARNMYAYDNAQRIIAKEGELLERKAVVRSKIEGVADKIEVVALYANPIKTYLKMYHENILSLRRSLSLQSRVKDGEPRDRKNTREVTKEKESQINGLGDRMSLINRPGTAH